MLQTMDDLEQKCEDALYELCDARERYPLKCAIAFRKYIQLKNEIQMINKAQITNEINNVSVIDNVEQIIHFNGNFNNKEVNFKHLDFKLKNVISALNNLKAVRNQNEYEKTCKTNILLKS
ncbi:uncharacterized protein LOC117226717 [Megalopta genalis]|uniref:uncharacterized protein LOC117226717 n=1 Tax=Megalopta genalis TaxID=115081 RepID=UPI0014433294|nr:uncharacterized protein LOC117226717 [Megalopta genalis]